MTAPLLVVVGTRPEAIKLAPVVHALSARPGLPVRLCTTGQHPDLVPPVLDAFGLRADHGLDVVANGLSDLVAGVLRGMRQLLDQLQPAAVVVQGDTSSALAAALAAFHAGVPVAHVEAGLRTNRLDSPWPEEANRVLIARVARWHFAPTQRARSALLSEGVPGDRVFVTGNSVVDALHSGLRQAPSLQSLARDWPQLSAAVNDPDRALVLATCHRRESHGPGVAAVGRALYALSRRWPQVDFVLPLHPHPRVREPLRAALAGLYNVHLLPPLPHGSFLRLAQRASLILTDSGGVQEEAASLGRPVVLLRDHTERVEGVEAGSVWMVGAAEAPIRAAVERLLREPALREQMARSTCPYGDGRASERIAAVLAQDLSGQGQRASSLEPPSDVSTVRSGSGLVSPPVK